MSNVLKFSIYNAIIGLIIGLYIALSSGGGEYMTFIFNAPISIFFCGYLFWKLFINKKYFNRNEKLIVIGLSTGIISHFLCWILLLLETTIYNRSFSEIANLESHSSDYLYGILLMSGLSLFIFGWITVTCSIAIGYWVDRNNKNKGNYLFTSQRLGFRQWSLDDLDAFFLLNSNDEVMEHFPKTLTREETKAYIVRLQGHYKEYGHCYYATEIKETGEFIGFIGLAYQDFESDFTPNVDIGWRLKKPAWGKGYATEGATKCLDIAFNQLHLNTVISTCTLGNKGSEKVMLKIGMQKISEFKHPKLKEYPEMQPCLLYEIKR